MTDNLRGILAMLVGSIGFVLGDATVKLVSAELPPGEIIVLRGVLATAFFAVAVVALGAMRPLSVLATPMMALRLVAAAAATAFVVMSLKSAPLAVVNTVLQVTPLAVTAGAALVYGERVGASRWAAALFGFAGVLLIIQPGNGGLGTAAVFVLATLACTIVRDLTTRGLDHSIPSLFVAAASSAAIIPAGFLLAPFNVPWVVPSVHAWGLVTAAAFCFFVSNTLIIMGLRTGEIAVVAPFRYVAAPVSVLLGYWWWGDLPNAVAFLGIGMVVTAGLYMLHRERAGLRMAPAPAPQSALP